MLHWWLQEAREAGRKAPLPWNEAPAYSVQHQRRKLATLLARYVVSNLHGDGRQPSGIVFLFVTILQAIRLAFRVACSAWVGAEVHFACLWMLSCRVAHVIDVLATSSAACVAAAATAHIISTVIGPAAADEARKLCPQQFTALPAHQPLRDGQQANSQAGINFKVQVTVRDVEDMLAEQQQLGTGASVCSVK